MNPNDRLDAPAATVGASPSSETDPSQRPAGGREETLFHRALAQPPAARAAFLDRECAGAPALRARLQALLAAHEQPATVFGTQAETFRLREDASARPAPPGPGIQFAEWPDEAVGQVIGRYKLLEKIGEGGCGVVYVAEQTEPVRRRVALKVIKLGMDTKQVVARFEAERQALALMDHPNIAKVLDAGMTGPSLGVPPSGGPDRLKSELQTISQGRPYFVMELVRGIKITDYCDQNQLSTKERLELFIKVCQAIQHAHQKGIIHRDIKPSNILVMLHDGMPVPKVIDFGIAKATEGRLTDNTVYTQLHQFIGTPAYMSPEQAEMSGLDIDTRSDIYSLGVLLYELLTGSTPFDAKELMSGGIDAMRKTIREKEPQRPSTRLAQALVAAEVTRRTSGGAEESASSRRRLQEHLHQLKGDLDWIVMKCLEKDRQRRYDTANGLAADLKRHLSNEPVTARPPNAGYRLQKAFRRNKLAFTAGAAVGIALLLGVAAASWQAVRATRARNEAVRAEQRETEQRRVAEAAEKLAEANARQAAINAAQATAALYQSLLGQARATRIARQVGYREDVFDLVQQARDLDTPAKDQAALRHEAVASMGDFLGYRPRLLATAATNAGFDRMRLSPDGRVLALATATETAATNMLLELPKGRELGRWPTDTPASDLAFNRAGDRLVSIHLPRSSAEVDSESGRWARARVADHVMNLSGHWELRSWRTLPGAFACLAVSNTILVAAADEFPIRRLRLVEPATGTEVASLAPDAGVWAPRLAVSLDGHQLALVGAPSADDLMPEYRVFWTEIEIWDLLRGQFLRRLPIVAISDPAITFAPDGRLLLCVGPRGTWLYDTDTLKVVDEFSGWASSHGTFLPNTSLLVVPRPQQRRFLVRDYQQRLTVAAFDEAEALGTIAAASAPQGEFLVTHGVTGVRLYPFGRADECLRLPGHSMSVPGIAFSPDGTRLASVSKDRTVRLWDAQSGQRLWEGEQPLPGLGQVVAFSPDGALLATGVINLSVVQLWDTATGRELRRLTNAAAGTSWAIQFFADREHGLRLVCAGGDLEKPPRGMDFWHLTSSRAVVAGAPGAVRLLESRHLRGKIESLTLSPDGQVMAFQQWNSATLYTTVAQDVSGTKAPVTLEEATPAVQSLAFTPDSQSMVGRTQDGHITVFNWLTGKPQRSFATHQRGGEAKLTLNPSGTLLAIESPSSRSVEIYDFATGRLRYTLPDEEGTVYWLAWHPTAPRLAVARDNGGLAIWDLAKIDRQLEELGLGFGSEAAHTRRGPE